MVCCLFNGITLTICIVWALIIKNNAELINDGLLIMRDYTTGLLYN